MGMSIVAGVVEGEVEVVFVLVRSWVSFIIHWAN